MIRKNSPRQVVPNVRELDERDAPALLEYFQTLVRVDPERVERPEDIALLSVDDEREWIRHRMADLVTSDLTAHCAVLNDRIVAVGELQRMKRWIERHVAEIRFGVLPDARDAALALVRAFVALAKVNNIELLVFFHLATQERAIEVMLECGFQEVARIPGYYKKPDGTMIDRVYLVKIL